MIQIDACKQGDKKALGQLYTAYSHKLLRVCLHYVKDESIAEDILHDAFIIIFKSIDTLKDRSKLEGWMITIVRNLALRHLQSKADKEVSLSVFNMDMLSLDDSEADNTVDLGTLLSAIESLPEGSREVFRLSVLDGLSHKEIGKLLHIAPHSSSSQLFRAKKMLRKLLVSYWMLLLLPLFIPIYIYIMLRDSSENTQGDKAVTIKSRTKDRRGNAIKVTRTEPREPEYTGSATHNKDYITAVCNRQDIVRGQGKADSIMTEQPPVTIHPDSLQRYIAGNAAGEDSLLLLQRLPTGKIIAMNDVMPIRQKTRYPWTFNFGYSSNAGSNNSLSNLNYLSVVDYANGGAAAKLYTWTDYIDYMNRNRSLMDSVERAKLEYIAINNISDGEDGLGEKAYHSRPITFGLSLNRQLSPRWSFGTGFTYTRLKSEFESDFGKATIKKTQKIDYLGIPLRLTYRIWGKGRFNAYTSGGVTFEIPVHSSLNKEYIITSDSTFTLKENIKPRYQWSVNWGVGIQYRIFKPFSLYVEPNMFYYFRNGSGIETYRTDHPFTFTIPFGLRLTW